MQVSLFGLLLLTQPLHSSEQQTRANFLVTLCGTNCIKSANMGLANMHQLTHVFFCLEYVQGLKQGVSQVAIDFLGQSPHFFFQFTTCAHIF